MNSILSSAVSALDTFSSGWQELANNIANANTDGFEAGHARYQDASNAQGVQLNEIRRGNSAGENSDVIREGHGDYINSVSREHALDVAEEASRQAAVEERPAEQREASKVELERELSEAIILEQTYAANAAVVNVYDDMMGTVLDVIV